MQDFIWWSGLTTADARYCVELVDRHLRQELIDEKVYLSPRAVKSQKSTHSAHLLPAYDEYTVAYKDRETIYVRTNGKPSITTWGLLGPIVIVDGQPVGTWKRTNNEVSLNVSQDLKEPEDQPSLRPPLVTKRFCRGGHGGRPYKNVCDSMHRAIPN